MTINGLGDLGGLGGALGGLMGGLARSGLVPTDTPEGKLMRARSEVADLRRQEAELLAEIGRQAYEADPSAWPQDARLRLLRDNLALAEDETARASAAQEAAKAALEAQEAKGRCQECGYKNGEDVKFCQECGGQLGSASDRLCGQCGAQLAAAVRFCGGCGAKQGD
ncbi:MAG: zinc ribbon domain-containing protein [Bifidobacteriaceae bacterium]|nr:zinc ribbon domain-containing protein [Bifidobacteriaceae bacterium]